MGKHLGALIRTARKQHGLTLDQLATKCSVSKQAVSQWERGLASPREGSPVFDVLKGTFAAAGDAITADFQQQHTKESK